MFAVNKRFAEYFINPVVYFYQNVALSVCRPEMLIKRMEKKVNQLVEESAHASAMGDYQTVSRTPHTHLMTQKTGNFRGRIFGYVVKM